jgi:hypothetical protein
MKKQLIIQIKKNISRLMFGILLIVLANNANCQNTKSSLLKVNYEKLVSRADITLNRPVSRREAGMPIGNGRMGSLVWTTPTMMKFQINRDDVYANGASTNSFNTRDSDYGFGVGFIDIDFGGYADMVFPQSGTKQHLSVYNGLLSLEGAGIKARVMAWNKKDVFAIEITDNRTDNAIIKTVLRMLRPAKVRTKSHLAISELQQKEGVIVLTQKFIEDDYFCSSALAISVLNRDAKVRKTNSGEMQLIAAPGKGTFTVLVASAASFDKNKDVVSTAVNSLKEASNKGFKSLLENNKEWWHNFWTKSFIHLESKNGKAADIEKYYTYYLYIMGSTSQGKYPPRFGGMLWNTGGDYRRWGVQHWFHNLSCYYRMLPETGRFDLMEPMYNMYSGMYKSCATAARQVWNSKGIWIPEAVWFNGMETLPENIAKEVQDLYLLRKPWGLRSKEFMDFAAKKHPHHSPWNWKGGAHYEKGELKFKSIHDNSFSYLVHIPTTTAKVAYMFWLKYEYTGDEEWLKERAYPMLKGTAEFFKNYPNLKKEIDGKYHIHNTNNHEPLRGCQDPMESVAAIRGIFPLAIKASKILGVDEDLRPMWQEILDNITTFPTNEDPNAVYLRKPGEPVFWVGGRKPYEGGGTDWGRVIPVVYYDLVTLENSDKKLRAIANASWNKEHPVVDENVQVHVLSRAGFAAAQLGRAGDMENLLYNQIHQSPAQINRFIGEIAKDAGIMDNRMTMREGQEAIGVQRLGRMSAGLQYSLLQSIPAAPGEKPIIHIAPAFPENWTAQYTLAARGGFTVTTSIKKGVVEFVELVPNHNTQCNIRNPWVGEKVTLYINGKKQKTLSGSLLTFNTKKGDIIVLLKNRTSPKDVKMTILAK